MTADLRRWGKARRLSKVVLITIAAGVGFLIIVIAGLLLYPQFTKEEDAFVLENAAILDTDFLQKLDAIKDHDAYLDQEEVPVYAHRLKRGSGTVFAWRRYSAGQPFIIDDEYYWKVTAWIAGPPPASTTTISLGDQSKAILVFSEGGSAWPRNVCSGYANSGTITVTPSGQRFRITIDAKITAAGHPARWCTLESVHRSFTATKIAFEDLTPWLGIAGHGAYFETYRH
jgi:hypothetical protein